MNNSMLELINVTKKIGKIKIIDDLSLIIESGQVYGFLGPNGAGKTTTIKMITGLISVDSGNIKINGFDVKKQYEQAMENVGAIVENPDLYGYLSGLDNIKLFARIRNISNDRISEVVKLVDLKSRLNDKVKKYSLGMKQRLGLAIALLHKPKVLILDEPTNGLDPAGIKELRDTLKKLAHKEGISVFVSSHLLSEMQLMCDKVAIIDGGKLIKIENINEKEYSGDLYTFKVSDLTKSIKVLKDSCECYEDSGNLIVQCKNRNSDLIKILLDNEIEIFEFRKKEGNLEEEFLKITGGIK